VTSLRVETTLSENTLTRTTSGKDTTIFCGITLEN